jgi:hypothetical protein
MAYNQSRIKMFRRCQKQYSFRYDTAFELGLDPTKEMVPKFKKVQLERGSWMHALQEAHHREWAGVKGPKWREVHDDFTAKYNGLFLEEREEYGDLPGETERMWKGYLRFWADDADRYSVVEFDDGPAIEFMVEQPLKKWGVSEPFKGRIDLLVEDVEYGGYWVWDHKWVSRILRRADDEPAEHDVYVGTPQGRDRRAGVHLQLRSHEAADDPQGAQEWYPVDGAADGHDLRHLRPGDQGPPW